MRTLMNVIVLAVALASVSATPLSETCEATLKQVNGVWMLHSCTSGGCDGDPCIPKTLIGHSGNSWTSCLCNGEWSQQQCSAVLREGGGTTEPMCLRGGCIDCAKHFYATPEGEPRFDCYCP